MHDNLDPLSVREDYSLFDGVTTPTAGVVTNGGHSITGTAALVDPAANNYRIGPNSAARDAALEIGVARDFEGDARPIGNRSDIDYDEHGGRKRVHLPAVRR